MKKKLMVLFFTLTTLIMASDKVVVDTLQPIKDKIKIELSCSHVWQFKDKEEPLNYVFLTEKRYWTSDKKKNYGYGHIAQYVALYKYGVTDKDGKEIIPPVLDGISEISKAKAKIQIGEQTGWVYLNGKVEWDNHSDMVTIAKSDISKTLLTEDEKLKLYRKERVFRTVKYPQMYDFEIIRGDKMQQDGGFRTGIYINGKEKIVGIAPQLPYKYTSAGINTSYEE